VNGKIYEQVPSDLPERLFPFRPGLGNHRASLSRCGAAGYPVNQDTALGDFYAWYMKHKLYRVAMNNVGDPYKQSRYSLNSHEFEQEVVNYFARLYGFKEGDYWGFVTATGTDGNNHGIYFGRKYLKSKSSAEPIIYVSAEAHYSIKKLADVQNTELRLIKATDMGQMDMGDFEKQLDAARPALVVIAMGTTFKGAMDDQSAIPGRYTFTPMQPFSAGFSPCERRGCATRAPADPEIRLDRGFGPKILWV
jgi:hypothetical protein